MNILSGNLAEGKPTTTATVPSVTSAKQVTSGLVEIKESNVTMTSGRSVPHSLVFDRTQVVSHLSVREPNDTKPFDEQVHIFLRFTFTMESFIVDLFTNEGKSKLVSTI